MNSLEGSSVLHLSHKTDGCLARNVVSTFFFVSTEGQQLFGSSRTVPILGV